MTCKNCGQTVDENFCSHCGQKTNVDRINFPNFISQVSESVFQVNKGFFYTLRELSVRPGNSLNEFLNGKRKNHFKPIAYVLTLSTVYFLITQVTSQNTWVDDLITGWMNGATGQESRIEVSKTATWFAKNFAYTTLLLLPIFSLASYLSFSKYGKTYLEHIVVNSYITGHQAIFYYLFAIVGAFVKSDIIVTLSLLVAISYAFWGFRQFFLEGNRTVNILRTVMTYVLYLLFSFVLLLILMGLDEL